MYGTRPVAQHWLAAVAGVLGSLGFVSGKASPTIWRHESKDLWVLVHGDDILAIGEVADLEWHRDSIANSFLIESLIWGSDRSRHTHVRCYAADMRHGEQIGIAGCMPLTTPGSNTCFCDCDDGIIDEHED